MIGTLCLYVVVGFEFIIFYRDIVFNNVHNLYVFIVKVCFLLGIVDC